VRSIVLVLFVAFTSAIQAASYNLRLEIFAGNLVMFDNSLVPVITYSDSLSFSPSSPILVYEDGDVITLTVVNSDTQVHGFKIDGVIDISSIVPSGSITQVFTVSAGVYKYYDPTSVEFQYMGLSGTFHVKNTGDNTPYFYWNLREHEPVLNNSILTGGSIDQSTYSPKYYTINGNSGEYIDNDIQAKITGNVSQEFRLLIMNVGLSVHSIHFHGYHLTILDNSKNSAHNGRDKDTFPVYPGEYQLLSGTPDKPGEYPVHDHNLVAVTGGGQYHTGMITTMVIAP
jgi:FtsP/CotA-like multicopper oxidase with cupredoxin domain